MWEIRLGQQQEYDKHNITVTPYLRCTHNRYAKKYKIKITYTHKMPYSDNKVDKFTPTSHPHSDTQASGVLAHSHLQRSTKVSLTVTQKKHKIKIMYTNKIQYSHNN